MTERRKDPAEFTRDMPEGEGAGEGAPETDEPVQGRSGRGPGGPASKGLGTDPPKEQEEDAPG